MKVPMLSKGSLDHLYMSDDDLNEADIDWACYLPIMSCWLKEIQTSYLNLSSNTSYEIYKCSFICSLSLSSW
jgi:hypothetical protein